MPIIPVTTFMVIQLAGRGLGKEGRGGGGGVGGGVWGGGFVSGEFANSVGAGFSRPELHVTMHGWWADCPRCAEE